MLNTERPKPWSVIVPRDVMDSSHAETQALIGMANRLLHLLVPLSQNPSRTGGWLMVHEMGKYEPSLRMSTWGLSVRLQIPIGYMDRPGTYRAIALEKTRRLYRTFHEFGHRSSHLTRSPGHGRYGGAIVAERLIFSFSGLEEHDDEALVLMLAVWLGVLSVDQATKLAEISCNSTFASLLAAFEALSPEAKREA